MNSSYVNCGCKHISPTFLQHFKGSRLSFEDVVERTRGLEDRDRASAFLAVFRPVFERYQESLAC